jgi:hypothetical protein
MTDHPPPTANGAPTHTEVRFEESDFSFRSVLVFGVGLALAIVVVSAGLWLYIESTGAPGRQAEAPKPPPLVDEAGSSEARWRAERKNLGRGDPTSGLPPRPTLEALDDAAFSPDGDEPLMRSPIRKEDPTAPKAAIDERRSIPIGRQIADEESWLRSYGWVGDKKETAHIPIDEAMKRVAGQLPTRGAKP